MAKSPSPQVDTSALTDSDWAELEMLKQALEAGGQDELSKAQRRLRHRDPFSWFRIVRTFYPHLMPKIVGEEDNRDGSN
jgi:hypothetical protein